MEPYHRLLYSYIQKESLYTWKPELKVLLSGKNEETQGTKSEHPGRVLVIPDLWWIAEHRSRNSLTNFNVTTQHRNMAQYSLLLNSRGE